MKTPKEAAPAKASEKNNSSDRPKRSEHPFRSAVIRGLGVVMPPLLTIVIFLWVGSTVQQYVLEPVTTGLRDGIVWATANIQPDPLEGTVVDKTYRRADDGKMVPIADIRPESTEAIVDGKIYWWRADDGKIYWWRADDGKMVPIADIRPDPDPIEAAQPTRTIDDTIYWRTGDDKMVPIGVYEHVQKNQGAEPIPPTAQGIYQRYVELRYLRPYLVIPAFLAVFILVLYLLGKFIAAGIGRFFVNQMEQGILSLPLVRNVYSSVKQISDFLFSPREIEYTRVVAIEYPRKGVWSLGLVTGESMLDIRSAANEPVISVLVPTSPMPVTGYTINIRKSEAIDLNITIDQAFQFIVSCGVVVPPQQVQEDIDVTPVAPQLPDDAAK